MSRDKLNSNAITKAVFDPDDRTLRLGPFTVQVDAGSIGTDDSGTPIWDLPFANAWFFRACGYLTWARLAEAFGLDAWSGWYRVSGQGVEYGTWVAVDAEASRVLARLAGQDLLIEWRADAIVITTPEPDGPTATIDIPDACVAAGGVHL